MKKLFEFKCTDCASIFEELTAYKQVSFCPYCNGVAEKVISAPRISLEGVTGAFPGAASLWEKKHKDKLAQESKRNSSE